MAENAVIWASLAFGLEVLSDYGAKIKYRAKQNSRTLNFTVKLLQNAIVARRPYMAGLPHQASGDQSLSTLLHRCSAHL